MELSEKLILQLMRQHNVETFCLCPGGRSAALTLVLSQIKKVKVFTFFEERSAGFFALGRGRRDNKPCAIITTSGTAVAELLPSVIEAYYSHVPLVIITADRPSSYRNTGAPQSIEQIGIFSHYVQSSWDLEQSRDFDLSSWDRCTPCHINVCFDEPLIDIPNWSAIPKSQNSLTREKKFPSERHLQKASTKIKIEEEMQIKSFFSNVTQPLWILSELPVTVRKKIEMTLSFFPWPIYAEALSGLRESSLLHSLILKSGESVLTWLVLNKKIDGVIRVGRRPCTRFWRDLDTIYSFIPVLSISDQNYSGLSRALPAVCFSSFFKWTSSLNSKNKQKNLGINKIKRTPNEVFKQDKLNHHTLTRILNKHPLSEPALIRQFSQKIPSDSLLFLGNSLPIREWDIVAPYQPDKKLKYIANRGANGIDGLLSTFFGACEPDRQNWCLIGDLSCLYDLSAPWIQRQLNKKIHFFLVIVNNSGGQIFSSLSSNPIFLNSHNLTFKKWAEMWDLSYYCIQSWPQIFSFSSPCVIELKINPDYTKKFKREFHSLIKQKNRTGL